MHWCEPWGAWVVTRHDIVSSVVKDPKRFASGGYELRVAESLERQFGVELPSLRAHYAMQHRRLSPTRPSTAACAGPSCAASGRACWRSPARGRSGSCASTWPGSDGDVIDLVPELLAARARAR